MNEGKEQIFDIYDIWYEPLLTQTWFIITLIVFLTIIVTIVLYFIYVRFFNQPVKIDSLAIIQQRLSHLFTISIENEQDSKQVYFELTELMKQYIDYQYNVSIKGLTDKEIINWACEVMSEHQINMVKQLLLDSSSIKFEHQVASTEQVKKDIRLMQEFIDKTIQESTNRKDV